MKYPVLSIFLLFLVSCYNTPEKSGDKSSKVQEIINKDIENRLAQKIMAVEVPGEIYFCNERVHTEFDDVKERLDRELLVNSYWHSNSIQLFKIANRYFPLIEKVLEEEGVPPDLKFVALTESGLKNVVSPRGAEGSWQFLKGTAKEYGLEVSSTVDERYHLEKSTRAAAAYLREAYEDLGSWTLATAAYNIGRPRLKRILKQQKEDNYYALYLNEETARYVFRIVALKEIFTNPEKYGFNLDAADLYQPFQTRSVLIDTSINNLVDFAIGQGINYKTLKILNPWLRDTELKNRSGKEYFIKLPH
ncbi:MAG: lytic transglycosylase domain-containing protein [Chitinophagales bacterium]